MSIRAIAGPTPRRYQSGETDIWGGSADAASSWRAPRSHEVTLYEAAHSLLMRSRNGRRCGQGGCKSPTAAAWQKPGYGNESTAANQNPEQKQDLLDETHPNTRGR
jgi:hypothetical protein